MAGEAHEADTGTRTKKFMCSIGRIIILSSFEQSGTVVVFRATANFKNM